MAEYPPDSGLPQPVVQVALIAATLAAVIVLIGLFSDAVRYGLVGVIVVAVLATAAERERKGGGWWVLFAAGGALSAVGAGVAELSETVGGLIAVAGGALVVIGATIGFPVD